MKGRVRRMGRKGAYMWQSQNEGDRYEDQDIIGWIILK
jgi:hypothetical protein